MGVPSGVRLRRAGDSGFGRGGYRGDGRGVGGGAVRSAYFVTYAELAYALSQYVQAIFYGLFLAGLVVGLRVMWPRRWF